MNTALKFALVLLATSAGHQALAWQTSLPSAQFFVGNSPHSQGYLGVDIRDVSPDEAASLHLKSGSGAEIVLVDHDAPAGKAGLHEHDVVLQLNGQAVTGEDQVRRMLHELPPGRAVVLVINRAGQQMTITTQMTTREAVEREAWQEHLAGVEEAPAEPAPSEASDFNSPSASAAPHTNSFLSAMLLSPSYTGAMLEKMSTQLASYFGVPGGGGLLVRSVQPDSPAAHAGMQAGDVVLRANNRSVNSTGDWAKAIKVSHGKPVTIVVLRDRKQQTLTLIPDSKRRS